jgi:bifunctional non-homologous end joining protein LigD
VLTGVDGRSDFNGLHSRKRNHEAELYEFDILVTAVRRLPLGIRKANLAQLLARRINGIHLAPFEQARSVLIFSGTHA